MKANTSYVECTASNIPARVRWDVPARFAGQTVEVAWSAFGGAEEGPGAPFKRVKDRSDGSVKYFQRVGPAPGSDEAPATRHGPGAAAARACGDTTNVTPSGARRAP